MTNNPLFPITRVPTLAEDDYICPPARTSVPIDSHPDALPYHPSQPVLDVPAPHQYPFTIQNHSEPIVDPTALILRQMKGQSQLHASEDAIQKMIASRRVPLVAPLAPVPISMPPQVFMPPQQPPQVNVVAQQPSQVKPILSINTVFPGANSSTTSVSTTPYAPTIVAVPTYPPMKDSLEVVMDGVYKDMGKKRLSLIEKGSDKVHSRGDMNRFRIRLKDTKDPTFDYMSINDADSKTRMMADINKFKEDYEQAHMVPLQASAGNTPLTSGNSPISANQSYLTPKGSTPNQQVSASSIHVNAGTPLPLAGQGLRAPRTLAPVISAKWTPIGNNLHIHTSKFGQGILSISRATPTGSLTKIPHLKNRTMSDNFKASLLSALGGRGLGDLSHLTGDDREYLYSVLQTVLPSEDVKRLATHQQEKIKTVKQDLLRQKKEKNNSRIRPWVDRLQILIGEALAGNQDNLELIAEATSLVNKLIGAGAMTRDMGLKVLESTRS